MKKIKINKVKINVIEDEESIAKVIEDLKKPDVDITKELTEGQVVKIKKDEARNKRS